MMTRKKGLGNFAGLDNVKWLANFCGPDNAPKAPIKIKLNQNLIISVALMLVIAATTQAEARDLVDAAQSAQSVFNKIGIAAISIGITVGGILYAVGAAMIGRMLLFSGFIGAMAVLGAPAIINLLGKIFGASV